MTKIQESIEKEIENVISKGKFEVYGEAGMGIDYTRLEDVLRTSIDLIADMAYHEGKMEE